MPVDVVDITEIPECGTDEMVTLIHHQIMGALAQAQEFMSFTLGDAMSAAMHLIVEAGLGAGAPPDKLRSDMIEAFDLTLADYLQRRRSMQ